MTVARQATLGRELGLLEGAGLISLASSVPELEYAFRHALIQDAAYATLLKQERRVLHTQVAETLLTLYPDRRGELAAVLGNHFEQAGDEARAIEYLALAARHAESRYARRETIELTHRALLLLPSGDAVSDDQRRERATLSLLQAEAGAESAPLSETLALLSSALADAEAIDDTVTSARAYLSIAAARAFSGEQLSSSPELAHALERATALAEASGSDELVALALLRTGQAHWAAHDLARTIELLEAAVPALIEVGCIYCASVAAGQLGTAYGHVGAFDQAVQWTDRSYELGITSGDPNASLDADLARAIVEGIRGDSATSIAYARKAAEAARRVDNKACAMVAHSVIGEAHLREGDPTQAAVAFEASADLAAFCQYLPVKIEQTDLLLRTARARSGVGEIEIARYDRAIELARQFGDRLVEAQLYEQRAQDRIAAGQGVLATGDLEHAAAMFEALGATPHTERVEALRARIANEGGEAGQASTR
jgi:tetratricopeptide (TPR) repeat protein